jgi:hypothetical protein
VFIIDDTGSMGGAIANVKSEVASLVSQIVTAAEGDYQLGLITFKDSITVRDDLASGNADAVRSHVLSLAAFGGDRQPEASDESLNTAVNRLPAAGRPQSGDFNGSWRASARKVAILITDAPPGGFDDVCTAGIDDVNAHTRAVEAANAGIRISAVFVPTAGRSGASNDNLEVPAEPMSCDARAVMQDYAATSGGIYTETAQDGSGTAAAIRDIIASCGEPTVVPEPTAVPEPVPSPAPTPIPEPTTILLLGGGAAAVGAYLRKRGRSADHTSDD